MTNSQSSNWAIFRLLCRALGGQDLRVLIESAGSGLMPKLIDLAQQQDLLPALAVRCEEQGISNSALGNHRAAILAQALRENTMRNMQISAQALKLTRRLNEAGITPLFLKGTVQLLDPNIKNLGFRKQVDIDLLVKPEQLETAAEVFLAENYGFYEFSVGPSSGPTLIHDTPTAIKRSTAHHHLPPLAKDGYSTTVELHSHFLPKRFQRKNPIQPLFSTSIQKENHSVRFLIPSTEYQIIHLILGKLIHDGHFARSTFPLREACDYIYIMENAKGRIDHRWVEKHCGNSNNIFTQLVSELMVYTAEASTNVRTDIKKRLQIMQRRYNSPAISVLLNSYARTLHLTQSLVYSHAKLPTYLRRLSES